MDAMLGLRQVPIVVAFACVLLCQELPKVARGQTTDGPDSWFAKPYELPQDVFDLPEFSQFRKNGVLDIKQGLDYLGRLSDANLPEAQRLFDVFAWEAFVALNWASTDTGEADPSKDFTDVATPRVWEHWKQSTDIFLAEGAPPAPWTGGVASRALDHFKAGWRMDVTADQGKQAFSGPLIDQNGHWVHYVSLVNKREFDYIVENELYNLEGQAAFLRKNRISFPVNDGEQHGAIEIKLAWKDMTDAEVRSGRFLVRRLPVVEYRPPAAPEQEPLAHMSGRTAANGSSPPPREHTVGLIGMHIAMHTQSSPQWIWATFEQVDNTRLDPARAESGHPLPPRPSLSNPDDPRALVEANVLPNYNAAGGVQDWDESKPLPPVEVLRVVPPPQGTASVNARVQSFLRAKNSVLRFYELDGTQWPTHPQAAAVPGGENSAPESIIRKMPGEVVPVYLTNATMETYFQKGLQQAGPLEQDNRLDPRFSTDTKLVFGTESCVGCHYSAGAAIAFRKDPGGALVPIFGENANDGLTGNANFSWLLQLEAKSKASAKGK
jgi:hypothetical protein